ncbi:hypothetical protein L1887_45167 [Cichorium endivia]|nr:hypothetical protein L1887_45167 [Cichorium endivia]
MTSLRSLATGSALLFLFAPTLYAAEQAAPEAPLWMRAPGFLMDYSSGKVLAEGNADEKLDPASLTKIMTSYVVGQALKAGKIKLDDMSGNDACIALADYVAGSQDSFIGLMNGYAQKLGLTNTTFKTVHGLDSPGQFSTARDMALLGKALIHDVPDEYAIHKEKEFTFNKIRQPNRNRLLWSSNVNSEKLLTWGFRFYETVTPIKPDATFVSQRVWFGDKSEVNLGAGEAGSVTIPRGQLKNLKASYTLTDPQLTAPLKKGQVVGTIDFQLNGKSIEQRSADCNGSGGRGRLLQPDVGFRDDEIPRVVWQLV